MRKTRRSSVKHTAILAFDMRPPRRTTNQVNLLDPIKRSRKDPKSLYGTGKTFSLVKIDAILVERSKPETIFNPLLAEFQTISGRNAYRVKLPYLAHL